MSVVQITNVNILEPESHFLAPYKFEITFECLSPLEDDLEFKLVYVGSADNTTLDQELDSLLVGPVPVGVNKFVFEAEAPKVDKIPNEDIVGVTVILLSCSYKEKEFVRIGYYVDNLYIDEELQANTPEVPVLDKIFRRILADKPRVTRFPINWDDPHRVEVPPVQRLDGEMCDDDDMDTDLRDGDEIVGGEDDDDEEEDELEDEDEEDEDEKGEVDLDMTEEQDEAEILSDDDDEGAVYEDDDDNMATDDAEHSRSAFGADAASYSAISTGGGMDIE
ncbi:ASF1 like histone chaperone-domain-containing protein [Kickxella alabastrina]|uniref:ASF1 like histone chaperone-domain-containing protein n=1 Tax=Kickxella alabastrina TaxID=61397 RepID=UPI0022210AF7|nr:ASF1 like histone chaperone-domain-containing protein [Kickxella alabastrina]KAI7829177.1 ASF1 like histone chaperone-domain-containing protein [Kickxella alabastrina]KAJ1946858.1 Histone chaperone asf1 [Kickxella alabastrina]